nr:hypothetical protein [Paracoccus saliphilus]
MKADWNEAVTYAREQLDEALLEIKKIESTMSQHESQVLDALTQLNELSASDTSWITEAREMRDLTSEGFARATQRGLAPSGESGEGAGPYISCVRTTLADATRDPVAFDAAKLHAKKPIHDNFPLVYELKCFACAKLGDEVNRPAGRRPRVHEARDVIFHAIIFDLAQRFDVKPTKYRAYNRICACDILAAAMPKKADLPDSYESLQRIWFKGERTWKREQLEDKPDLLYESTF